MNSIPTQIHPSHLCSFRSSGNISIVKKSLQSWHSSIPLVRTLKEHTQNRQLVGCEEIFAEFDIKVYWIRIADLTFE